MPEAEPGAPPDRRLSPGPGRSIVPPVTSNRRNGKMQQIKLVYFAWVREKVGRASEERSVPGTVRTAADLIAWLAAEDEGCAAAFAAPATIRVAIDQAHAPHDAPIAGAREIAFFPPVTGG